MSENVQLDTSGIYPRISGDTLRANILVIIRLKNDGNESNIKDRHLYYIDIECLKTIRLQELLKIFLNKSDISNILNYIARYPNHHLELTIDIQNESNYLKIDIKNNNVVKATWPEIHIIEAHYKRVELSNNIDDD